MGLQMHQLLATHCVASLVALTHLASFAFKPWAISRPSPAIEGPVGDTTFVSLVGAAGTTCEE
jgi:hypothetical protein